MTQKVSLRHWRFLSFLTAQFLGAFNDNAFKLVVSMASLSMFIDPAQKQSYLATTSALAILPFLLFSGYAGYFADRYAKSSVLRISKAAEILAMLAALIVFMTGQSITHLLITLFLLATHSAFFSPSKYGILPEILAPEELPKANGYLNMLTFVAIITGSLSGATLWGMYKSSPVIIGEILTAISVVGTLLCLFVPNSRPGNAHKPFKLNPFGEILHSFAWVRGEALLASCMIGSALFWLLGGLIYLSLIMLGREQLGLSESAAGSLFAFLAAGIAVGSVTAGHLIGKLPARPLIVCGALLLGGGCILTGLYATGYAVTAALMALVGFGGGLFIVPVMTLLQKHSPEEKRGQLLAASSFFDMLGVFLASGIFWLLGTQAGFSASTIIMTAGGIGLVGLLLMFLIAPTWHYGAYALLAERLPMRLAEPGRDTLDRRFIRSNKRSLFALRLSDTTGQRLHGWKALVGARMLSLWLEPKLARTQNVAVLLPASVAGALTNVALAMLGKTSVNLNFSLGHELMEAALTKAEVTHIVTSRRVIGKLGLPEDARMLYIEDVAPRPAKRWMAMLQTFLLPGVLLCRKWLSGAQQKSDAATILFSSGSTAMPKAVVLTHGNLLANIDSVDGLLAHAEGGERYTLAGTLPFFHAFGLTACLWLPAITGRRVDYHANPLEAKSIVRMMAREGSQILITTPTFARHYAIAAGMLDSLRLLILGGEKMHENIEAMLTQAFPQAHILEGYGCTELGPVVAINRPNDVRKGSVGRPIPGVSVHIMDVAMNEILPPHHEGLIVVKSQGRMQGYYNEPAMTAAVLRHGWYVTGDIGRLDENGFLYITDRLGRFSKVAGEMVPHGRIEEALAGILSGAAVVVAVPDVRKGEKLCILTTESEMSPKAISTMLRHSGLPNLWVPAAEDILHVEHLPMLASGKLDLRACKRMAEQLQALPQAISG